MMRGRAAKAGAAGWRGAFAQGGEVLVFGLSGIDCRDAGGRCTTQAQRARELISEAVAAVGVPVLAGPERVGEIFGAPGQRDTTRRAAVGPGREHAFGGFGEARKSFGQGKRVSGRVDIGGRRYLHKQKTNR